MKFLLEGEEEIGSKNLEPFLRKHADRFKADVSLNPDAGMMGENLPTITYGLRGLAYFEIHITGPKATCTPACMAVQCITLPRRWPS